MLFKSTAVFDKMRTDKRVAENKKLTYILTFYIERNCTENYRDDQQPQNEITSKSPNTNKI